MDNFKSSGIFTKQAHVKIPEDYLKRSTVEKVFLARWDTFTTSIPLSPGVRSRDH